MHLVINLPGLTWILILYLLFGLILVPLWCYKLNYRLLKWYELYLWILVFIISYMPWIIYVNIKHPKK